MRREVGLIEEVSLRLADAMESRKCPYQAIDSSAVPVRDAKRRGRGWLSGSADIGWSGRLGWYEGFKLLIAVEPTGVVRGFGLCAASVADQRAAESFFAARYYADARIRSVGAAFCSGFYVADKGFEGKHRTERWARNYGAHVIHPPTKRPGRKPWPARLKRWLASARQVVETVYDKLHNVFGLRRERPHDMCGLRARLAATVALHNFCIWLNEQLGRPRLAFVDLLGW